MVTRLAARFARGLTPHVDVPGKTVCRAVAAGEYIKTWRRRWFVLKQGRIFWFKADVVTPVRLPPGRSACTVVHG
jgi:hypothetical protein